MDPLLALIGRDQPLFEADVREHEEQLRELVGGASFLVIGGAGSIGQAVVREIFSRSPTKLHVVDISENSLVELVRDLRSSIGYIPGEFRTFAVDAGSREFDLLVENEGPYDYVLNLSAMKHVRSERDPYTLMRLIDTNIFNTERALQHAVRQGSKKYFCVSTDKATNPVNMMGASKRIMELFLSHHSHRIPVSTARFANVAFSDGSLLHGFDQRIRKRQPISAPSDIRRYFITPKESGELCLLSCLLGENRDLLFPRLDDQLHLISFEEIARRYVAQLGYEAWPCESEQEARTRADQLIPRGRWPCFFSPSTTSGEKEREEFFTTDESPDMERFCSIGVLTLPECGDPGLLERFHREVESIRRQPRWSRQEIIRLFNNMLPEFRHRETGCHLDDRM
ncbi:MAG TPA: NAD-dependent epimerase/dehydratase family protein [Gammaproteobacteria bacterium]|nr:NAD-dependent epimerase/dehydratase family protein [Gammaproteobacteria bacterium]